MNIERAKRIAAVAAKLRREGYDAKAAEVGAIISVVALEEHGIRIISEQDLLKELSEKSP